MFTLLESLRQVGTLFAEVITMTVLAIAELTAHTVVVLVLLLVVCGIAWKFIAPYVAEPFRTAAIVVVALFLCLAILSWAGLF